MRLGLSATWEEGGSFPGRPSAQLSARSCAEPAAPVPAPLLAGAGVRLIWPEGKLSPQGVVARRSHPVSVAELHWRLLVSAAHLSEPGSLCRVSPSFWGPAPGLCVQAPPGPAARTWPTLPLSGRAVAGEGRRIPGKVPAAVPSAQLSFLQSSTELGGLRGPPGTQGR